MQEWTRKPVCFVVVWSKENNSSGQASNTGVNEKWKVEPRGFPNIWEMGWKRHEINRGVKHASNVFGLNN